MRKVGVLIVILFFLLIGVKSESKFRGHTYQVVSVPEGITWEEAKRMALDMGGYLAVITSAEENDFVHKLAVDDTLWLFNQWGNGMGPWLGGYQTANSPEPKGGWTWVNGEPWSYTSWAPLEPNNSGSGEDRLHLFGIQKLRGPHWNDLHRNEKLKGFVVEFEGSAADQSKPFEPYFQYVYQIPEQTDDGWETSSLSKEGVDSGKIEELMRSIVNGTFPNVYSVLLVRNGKLVLEKYFYGYDRDAKHQMHSVTKSITSILVGMAVDHKMIPSVDKKVYEFFPEYKGTSWIGQKYEIDLRDVLTMTAGLDWDETTYSYFDSRNTLERMFQSNNWVKYVLDRKVIESPGERFNYNGGLTLLLAAIIRNTSGLYADKFAEQYLFAPLGISDYHWHKHRDGTINSFGGLSLRPRDMAKIGYLLLKGGKWKGRQIVSQKWINESTREHKATGGGYGYGYQWWRGKAVISNQVIEAFWAWGRGGQFIFVFPSLDLVAVFTSEPYANPEGAYRPFAMLTKYIIPAQLAQVPPRKSIKLDPEFLDKYSGDYKFTHGDEIITIFRQGDRLYGKHSDGNIDELLPATEDQFFGTAKDIGDFLVNVVRDERGAVKHVIVHFAFRRLQLDKIK